MGRCNAPPPSRQASIHSFPGGGGARNFWGSARRYTAHRRLSPRTNPRAACCGFAKRTQAPRPSSNCQRTRGAELTAMRIKVCSGAALCQRICHIREQPTRSHRGAQPRVVTLTLPRLLSANGPHTSERIHASFDDTTRLPRSTTIILRSLLSANGPHTSERSEPKKALPARRRERFPQSPSGTIERNTDARTKIREIRSRTPIVPGRPSAKSKA